MKYSNSMHILRQDVKPNGVFFQIPAGGVSSAPPSRAGGEPYARLIRVALPGKASEYAKVGFAGA